VVDKVAMRQVYVYTVVSACQLLFRKCSTFTQLRFGAGSIGSLVSAVLKDLCVCVCVCVCVRAPAHFI
jgi:hypothetical protein